jgi:hypothetical protein
MGHLHSIVELKTKVSPPGIEPDLRASRARVRIRHTPATSFFVQHPAEESNLVRQIRSLPCRPSHSQGVITRSVSRPGLEPGPGHRSAWMPIGRFGGSNAIRYTTGTCSCCKRRNLESNQDQDLRRVLCCPLHHRDTRADDWIRTSINRFTRPAPFSVEPRRHKARARGVEPRPPVLEAGCSPRSTLVC